MDAVKRDTGTNDLLAELDNGVLTLTLNRPEARNAMLRAMNEALVTQLAWAELNSSVKCIVLTGAGKGFCAGGDVKGMAAKGDGTIGDNTIDSAIHMQRVMQRFGYSDPGTARLEIESTDGAQDRIAGFLFRRDWRDRSLFDVSLSLDRVPARRCADQIVRLAESPRFDETPVSRVTAYGLLLEAHYRSHLATSEPAGLGPQPEVIETEPVDPHDAQPTRLPVLAERPLIAAEPQEDDVSS